MIQERIVTTAKCDACAHINYADEQGRLTAGYGLTIVDYNTDPPAINELQVYACRRTHIGKAATAALEGITDPSDTDDDTEDQPLPLDAPPIPNDNNTP